MFVWEDYYVALPLWNQFSGTRNCLELFLPAKQDSDYLCFHCITLHEATMHNNQQKEASGDTDGSTNCFKKGLDHKLCIKTTLTNEIIIRRK